MSNGSSSTSGDHTHEPSMDEYFVVKISKTAGVSKGTRFEDADNIEKAVTMGRRRSRENPFSSESKPVRAGWRIAIASTYSCH